MSLYSLADDLFADMDKARAAVHPEAAAHKKKHDQRQDLQRDELRSSRNGGESLPWLTNAQDENERPPTIELLEGCLRDVQLVQPIRSGARLEPFDGSEKNNKESHTIDDDHASRVGGEGGSASPSEGELDRLLTPCWKQKTTPFRLRAEGGKSLTTNEVVAAFDAADIDVNATATASFVDFEREVERWEASADMNEKESPHVRTKFASYLSAKYLCGVMDPMPSSPIVCRLRRRVARRIDLLAAVAGTGVVTSTPTADADSKEGAKGLATSVSDRYDAPAFDRCGHAAVMSSDRRRGRTVESDALLSHSKRQGTCLVSSTGEDGTSERHRTSFADVRVGSSTHRLSSTQRETAGSSASGSASLPPWVAGAHKKAIAGLPHENLRNDMKENWSSTSSSTSNSPSDSESSRICLHPVGNDVLPSSGNERAAVNTKEMSLTLSETTRYALDKVRKRSEKGVGCPDATFRQLNAGARGREARFVMEHEKAMMGDGEGDPNPSYFPAEEIGGGRIQTVQRHAGRGVSKTDPARFGEKDRTKVAAVGGLWTCDACRQINDEIDAAEGCAACGRRRHRGRDPRPNKNGDTKLLVGPSGDAVADISTRSVQPPVGLPEEDGDGKVGSFLKPIKTVRYVGTGSSALIGDTKPDRIERRMVRSDRRGPYDMSSFAKMRKATQPDVTARLGLTREIQSLLSAIRR